MVINHNIAAMNAGRQLKMNKSLETKSVEKLASGYSINRAADDAAGLQISEKMRRQIKGLERGEKNVQDGISWLQVADGAMNEATEMIQRMRELAVYAANGTHSDGDRRAINDEIEQLKREINQLSDKAVFNGQKIFDKEYCAMEIEGCLSDMEIFDAAYNSVSKEVTYGGIIFQGNRISWDTISQGMVTTNPDTGKQVFKEGHYRYRDARTGAEINFYCKEGDEVPKITRTISVKADMSGVKIDGKRIGWDKVLDGNGKPCTNGNYHEGEWTIDYEGIKIKFTLGKEISSLQDMVDGINACSSNKVSYNITSGYSGTYEEKAVDVVGIHQKQYTNALKQQGIVNPYDVSYTVRAGNDKNKNEYGIWLEDTYGNRIEDSYITWGKLGISSWFGGDDIHESILYEYMDTNGDANDTKVKFSFQLSDITSLDSVIDGLDGMVIQGYEYITNYETGVQVMQDSNVIRGDVDIINKISHQEEELLGRDYDAKNDSLNAPVFSYDEAAQEVKLNFNDSANTSVIEMKGDVSAVMNEMQEDLREYADYVLTNKINAALSGQNPQLVELHVKSLDEIIGSNNITTSGYFSEIMNFDSGSMVVTDGFSSVITDGENYPAAFVDFSGLGTAFQLDELNEIGFNSTCKTCTNHYSIKFVSSGGESKTTEGYAYSYKKDSSNNYTLEIDIESLKKNGVVNGEDLAEAVVSITGDCYDFHYTQYAAEGSKLYIFDDRTQDEDAPAATFDTVPYDVIDRDTYNLHLEDGNGRSVDAVYEYDYGEFMDNIQVEMTEKTDGEYIKLADGSYVLDTDPINNANELHYSISIKYLDSNAADTGALDAAIRSYAADAMNKMLTNTKIDVTSTDYTYIAMSGEEHNNIAVGAEFEAVDVEMINENVIRIQNSGEREDVTKIPRIALSTVALGLSRANVMTQENALETMNYSDYALEILMKNRSMYGAYQNRLERTYLINQNTRENLQAAESRIRDTDTAKEMVKYSKEKILGEVGQAMLVQANLSKNDVIALLQSR